MPVSCPPLTQILLDLLPTEADRLHEKRIDQYRRQWAAATTPFGRASAFDKLNQACENRSPAAKAALQRYLRGRS
jgi:hypothetical protein